MIVPIAGQYTPTTASKARNEMRRATVCDEYSGSESAAAATTKALRSSASYEIRPETSAKNDEPPMHATMNVAKMSPNGGVVSAPAEKAGVLSERESVGCGVGGCLLYTSPSPRDS